MVFGQLNGHNLRHGYAHLQYKPTSKAASRGRNVHWDYTLHMRMKTKSFQAHITIESTAIEVISLLIPEAKFQIHIS